MDMITELGLFAIAIVMTYGLRLSLSKKLVVLLAFGLRLPYVVLRALHTPSPSTISCLGSPALDNMPSRVV